MKLKAFWIELGFLPVDVAYVPNAKVWRETLEKLGATPEPFPDSDGRCIWWDNLGSTGCQNVILISVGKGAAKYSMAQVAGIIAHECMHAWRHIREIMAEPEPSTEFEAYVMQALVQSVMHAHSKSRKKPWQSA